MHKSATFTYAYVCKFVKLDHKINIDVKTEMYLCRFIDVMAVCNLVSLQKPKQVC